MPILLPHSMPNRSTEQYYFNDNSISNSWFEQQTPSIVSRFFRKYFYGWMKKSWRLKKPIFLSISSLLHAAKCACLPKCRSRKRGQNNVNRYFQVRFFSLPVAFLRKMLTEWNYYISRIFKFSYKKINLLEEQHYFLWQFLLYLGCMCSW